MTKNEAKNLIIRNNAEWVWYETIDKIFDEFGEKLQDKDDEIELLKCRIEEAMKPKTCEGCRYGAFGVDSFGLEIECTIAYKCSRGQDDMFKPKDNA